MFQKVKFVVKFFDISLKSIGINLRRRAIAQEQFLLKFQSIHNMYNLSDSLDLNFGNREYTHIKSVSSIHSNLNDFAFDFRCFNRRNM